MALNNMSDGVGKKIVEALMMQDTEVSKNTNDEIVSDVFEKDEDEILNIQEDVMATDDISTLSPSQSGGFVFSSSEGPSQSVIDSAFEQSLSNTLGSTSFIDDFEYPANVAVLKQLIAKLPSGVSKQTGALIIKQTMEALGISMSSVLQEAKQVQQSFVNNSRDCQSSIIEYRKKIAIMEAKAQQYQKQSAVMNDIINLFLQASGGNF